MGNWHSIYHEALLLRLVSMAVILWMLLSSGYRLATRLPGASDSLRDREIGTYHDTPDFRSDASIIWLC
jgi:hypothetical protein